MSEAWDEIARGNLRAAGELRRVGEYRSSVSRAYFAVYAAVTFKLSRQRLSFPKGWQGPHHDQLPNLIRDQLRMLPLNRRSEVRRLTRKLYWARVGADYKPNQRFENADTLQLLLNARTALDYLGVEL